MTARTARGSAKGHRGRRAGAGHDEGEEGSERWMVTYADMLTLLLVLFIVLFSISVVNTSKFILLKSSLSSAFGTAQKSLLGGGNGLNDNSAEGQGQELVMPGTPVVGASSSATSPDSVTPAKDVSAQVKHEVEDFKNIEQTINTALARNRLSGSVQFTIDRRGLVITVVTNTLVFPGNSAVLLPGGQQIFAVITPPLLAERNSIEVDGYTNQVKVNTYPYPTGWELSSARAAAVVRYLVSAGVAESRLSAVGFSDQRPLYPPSDPRAITLNRRVEIVVLTSLPADAAATLPSAAAAH